ncbi:MAG: glycosyltransferase family 4 protein [Bryobacteraceae bacterium]|nr:glycosyltransferase family 4 protein [Bryobacteraceae bacterium]
MIYTAAHGGFGGQPLPLGGGAAIFEQLVEEWTRTCPFTLETITPAILGAGAPAGRDLLGYSESAYAAFCREFEAAATARILGENPADTVVLSNDVSEGPDFARLRKFGFGIYTIYHVDVVDYVASIYARGWFRPETLVRWYQRLEWAAPGILQLIFRKQRDSVLHSQGLIVPSERMRATLERCYSEVPPVHVLPWGTWAWEAAGGEQLRAGLGIPREAFVLLTLSRLSPEKGQDLLLEALLRWERSAPLPDRPVWLLICGGAAFMHGRAFELKLRRLASRLKRIQVHFAGHVTGAEKRKYFSAADLYVFPSRHESYGLTLVEALHAGLPAVCLDHHGAREVMRDDFGCVVPQTHLGAAIRDLLGDPAARQRMSDNARSWARTQRFSDRAAQLAVLLKNSSARV